MGKLFRANQTAVKRPYFVRTLFVVLAAVFLVVFVVEVSLYVGLRRLYEQTVLDLQTQLIEQSQSTTDTFLRQAERHAVSTASLRDMNNLINRPFDLVEGFDRFVRMRQAVSSVLSGFGSEAYHSAYAYSATLERVFTSEGFSDPEDFADFYFLETFQQEPYFYSWFPSRSYGRGTTEVVSYIVPIPASSTLYGSFLVVNVDADFLEDVITKSSPEGGFELFVTTVDGVPVFVQDNELFADFARSDTGQELLSGGDRTGVVTKVAGEDHFVAVRTLESTGWRYVALGNRDQLLVGMQAFVRIALIVAGLAVLVAVAAAITVARLFYRPVEQLTREVEEAFAGLDLDVDDKEAGRNELRRLAWEFSVLVRANQEYAVRMQRDREALQESLLRDILNRRFASVEELRSRAEELLLDLSDRRLGLLIIVSRPYEPEAIRPAISRATVEERVADKLTNADRLYVLAESGYRVLIFDLASAETNAEAETRLDDAADGLSEGVTSVEDQLVISAGIANSFADLSVLYRSAMRLYGMRRTILKRLVVQVRDLDPVDNDRRTTTDFEQAIARYRHALEILDLEGARDIGTSILGNLDTSPDLVYRQAKINEVGNALILVVLANAAPGDVFEMDTSPWATYQQLTSVQAIAEWLERTTRRLEEVMQAKSQARQARTVNRVRAEIEKRYNQPISLQDLADSQNLTPAYLSALFREETGTTISQVLAAKRLEHACHRLRQTDQLIKTIAIDAGYGQKQNMIRAFKRELGMTPGQYRESAQAPTHPAG